MSAPCPNCDNPQARETAGMRCETCGRDFAVDLGWWAISGADLIDLLRRTHAGEDPDLVYAEAFANAESEDVP